MREMSEVLMGSRRHSGNGCSASVRVFRRLYRFGKLTGDLMGEASRHRNGHLRCNFLMLACGIGTDVCRCIGDNRRAVMGVESIRCCGEMVRP